MYTQHFFIHGKPFGSAERDLIWVHGEVSQPWSVAFFCPECGDVWAKAIIEGSRFHVYAHPCEAHPSRSPAALILNVPGSIMIPLDQDYWRALPLPVLAREFELLAEHILRNGE